MICPPLFICTLKDEEEFELKMIAPKTPGVYTYSVILRSDSYLDFDVIQQIKVDSLRVIIVDNKIQFESLFKA